jgi:hypothetical protein
MYGLAFFLAVQWLCAELQLGYRNADAFACILLVCSLGDTQQELQKICFGQHLSTYLYKLANDCG